MKRLFIIAIIPILLSFIAGNDPPSKYYYKDSSKVNLWAFDADDTAIYIFEFSINIFDFKGDSKKYQIFYDKKFTTLAVDMEVLKKDKQQNYKRYSRNGQLLMSWTKSDNKYTGTLQRFYNDGKIRRKEYYDSKGKSVGDTTWGRNGKTLIANTIYDLQHSKSTYFYSDGKIKSEFFEGSSNAMTKFVIDYDSISGKPSYFMCRDTLISSYLDDGSEIETRHFRETSIDSVTVIKKQK